MHLSPVVFASFMEYPKNQVEFERKFSSDEECREYLQKLKFPSGFICSRCQHTDFWKQTRGRLTCANCNWEVSPLAGTVFQKSHVPLTLWFRACWWMTNQKQGVNALGLQRALGLGSYRTAWLMLQKLRNAMVRPGRELLKGELEVDEIYIGGPEVEGKKYRSTKQLILIAVEKSGSSIGRIRMKFIASTSTTILVGAIKEMIEPGSLLHTDGWRGYNAITDYGYKHQANQTPSNRKQKREKNILPLVHRVSSLFKRWILGTYQGRIDPKHLPQYLDEFVFRFNRRTSRSRGLLFQRLLENSVQVKPRTYQTIIKPTQHY